MATGGEGVVRALEAGGIRLAFGIPAVHNLPIYDALYGSKAVRSVSAKHEQGAGFMAIGSAYATGEPAACVVGCGPGATNAVTPVAEAYLDSVPMVVVAGGIRSNAHGKGALHDVSQLSVFEPITKASRRLSRANGLADEVLAAVSECRSGRPRPVFIEIPFDILASSAPGLGARTGDAPPERVDPAVVRGVMDDLERSERPLIVIGGGVNSSRAWDKVAELAETLSAPVVSTISAKGAYPEDQPLSIGQLWDGVAMGATERADVVLALGCRFSERSTASWRVRIGGRLIQVDADPEELGRNYPVAVGVRADAGSFLSELSKLARPGMSEARNRWASELGAAKTARDAKYDAYRSTDGTPMKPQRVVHELSQAIPDDALVVAETGHAFWWSASMLEVKRPRSFLSPSGNSTLGFGLPAAMGAKCATPDRPVVCLVGDGGFLFSCQELSTAVEERVPVVVVVFDDGGYSAIREYQRKGYGARFIGVDFSVKPDYVKMAESMGADGVVVEKPDDLRTAVREALRGPGTRVIDVPISRDEDVLPRFFAETYRQNR